ncbi:MAG: PIN domain-containing protein [Spirochaetaceae bacterium]|nr:PIN domain-containing protein [Spirochaetaceae bacterium]
MNYTDTKIFLDTNIIAYIFDSRDALKKQQAKDIFKKLLLSDKCCISTQVLQELFNVLTKKLKYTKEEARTIISDLMKIPVYQIKTADISLAMDLSIKTKFTIYDSLIIAAAKASNCTIVYSEDLNDGQCIDTVTVINPFK